MERQYIGARYVPKFWDNGSGSTEWTPNIPYESMIVVTYMNNSYTSKVPVPATEVTPNIDTEHWALTGAYNAQVEQYRKDVEKIEDTIAAICHDVKVYGAVGDGTTDDTTAIQNAINDAIADGGSVFFPVGRYKVHTISVNGSCNIDLNGSEILTANENGFMCEPENFTTSLTTGYTKGNEPKFTVASSSGIHVGDVVVIEDSVLRETSREYYYRGITAVVNNISGNNIFLSNAPDTDLSANCVVTVYKKCCVNIKNGSIRNIGSMNDAEFGIKILGASGSRIENLFVENYHKNIAIYYSCFTTVEKCVIGHSKSAGDAWDGYGISNASCSFTTIDSCSVKSGQHGISNGGWTPVYNTTINNCYIMNENINASQFGSLDAHGNVVNTVVNNCTIGQFAMYGVITLNNCRIVKSSMDSIVSEWEGSDTGNLTALVINNCIVETEMRVDFRGSNYGDITITNTDNLTLAMNNVNVGNIKIDGKPVKMYNENGSVDNVSICNVNYPQIDSKAITLYNAKAVKFSNVSVYARYNIITVNSNKILCENVNVRAGYEEGSIIFNSDDITIVNSSLTNLSRGLSTTGNKLVVIGGAISGTLNTIKSSNKVFIDTEFINEIVTAFTFGGTMYKLTRDTDGTAKFVTL